MKEKVLTLLIGFMALLIIGQSVQAQTATLISDQPDYLPGTTATFTGSGFLSGEIVKVQVLHYDGTSDGGEDHQSWDVTADVDGNLITTWHVCEDDCLGSTLKATADGLASLSHAEVIFTDAAFTSSSDGAWNNINTWEAVARKGTITATTGSKTVTGDGTFFLSEIAVGDRIQRNSNTPVGIVASITNNTSLILTVNSTSSYTGSFMAKKIPGPEDAVIIRGGDAVNITTASSCLTLQISSTTNFQNTILKINQGQTLTVGSGTGSVTIGTGLPAGYQKVNFTSLMVDGTLRSGNIQQSPPSVSSGGYGITELYISSTGIASVTGNVSGNNVTNGIRTSEATITINGGGILNLTGSLTTSQFVLSTNSTVNYNRDGPQTIRNGNYGNLILSGGGTKSTSGVTTVAGELSISAGVIASLGTFLSHTAGTLKLGGNGTTSGTWGSTSSLATHKNNNYFAASSGTVNVATGTCTNPSAPAAGNNTFVYDGTAKTATVSVGPGETVTWYAAATGTVPASAPSGTNAGNYSAYAEAGNSTPGCVSITRTLITLTIHKAPLTVTAEDKELSYGDAVPELAYQITGFVNSETTSVVSGEASLSTNYNNTTAASVSPLSITTAIGSLLAANYSFSPINGQIIINKANSTITVSGATSLSYNGLAQGSTTSDLSGSTGAVSYRYSGSGSTMYTSSSTRPVNAGTYQVTATVAADINFNGARSEPFGFTIAQAAALISVTQYDVTYDGKAHTSAFTAVGVETTPVDLTGLMTVTGTTHTSAGTYTADAWTFAGNGNYAATSGTVNNVISPAVALITVSPYSVIYNGAPHTSAFTALGVEASPVDLTALMTVIGTTHTNAGTYTADAWTFAGNSNYKPTSGNVDNAIAKAEALISVTQYEATYDGNAHTSTFTAAGVEGTPADLIELINVSGTTHTNAGTYTADAWTFAGNSNYNATSGNVNNAITQAAAVISVSPYRVTYNGVPHTSAFTAVGVEASPVDLSGLMTVTGTTHANAGTYTADAWTFAGNRNYNAISGNVNNAIDKAEALISVTPYSVSYDGNAHTSVFTAVGVESTPANLTALMTVSATAHTNADTYTADAWTFAGNNNYNASSGTVDNAIGRAAAVITVDPYSVTYDGNAHTSAFTAAGVESTPADLTALMTVTGTTHTNAGTYTADAWTFAGNSNYAPNSGTVNNAISQAKAVISVSPYNVTYNGVSHTSSFTAVGVEASPVDLTALMTVTGTTHTNAGTYTADAWTFAGNDNYAATGGTVKNAISQAAALINVSPYSVIYNGAPHTSAFTAVGVESTPADLTALMNVSGTTHTNAGTYTADAWTFAGDSNYAPTIGTVNNAISRAAALISVSPYSVTYNGAPHTSAFTAVGVETSPVDLTGLMTVLGTTHTNAGTYTADAWTFAGNGNYAATSGTVNNVISQAEALISVSPYNVTYNSAPHTSAFTAVGVEAAPADLTGLMTVTGTTHTNAGTYTADAWTFAGNSNYIATSGNVDNAIAKAAAEISVAPYSVTYDGNAHTSTFTAVGVETTPVDLTGLMTVTGTTHTNAGTYTADAWTFAGNSNYNATSGNVNNAIGRAGSVISVTPYSVTYDGNAHTSTFTAVGVEASPVDLTGLMTVSATTHTNVGTYTADAWTFAGNDNYTGTSGTVGNAIGRAVLTVTADPQSKYCGQPNLPPTFQYSGWVNGVEAIDTAPNPSTTVDETTSAGTYLAAITVTGGSDNNYSFNYIPGTFTVNGLTSLDANASSNPVPSGSTVTLSATVSPAAAGISVVFTLDNGNGVTSGYTATTDTAGLATTTVNGLAVGVYLITAKAGNNCASAIAYLPVYDPNNGFVTGGGWIQSPAGALVSNTNLTGKANFGFVAKYKKGSNTVDGNTEFQFQAGNFNFKSNLLDAGTLVISGAKATYRGVGTVNGTGNYGFMVSAIDGVIPGGGGTDKFRIKIWNKATGNTTVYDNQIDSADNVNATTLLGGGSIVIHEVKGGKQSTTTPTLIAENSKEMDMKIVEPLIYQKIKLGAYPNPFAKQATIAFTLPTDEQIVTLDVYDLKGSRIKRIYEGKASANQTLEFEFNGSYLSPGMYQLRLTTPKKVENFKMIMTE